MAARDQKSWKKPTFLSLGRPADDCREVPETGLTSRGFEPISPPRGLPVDLSQEIRAMARDPNDPETWEKYSLFGHSWLLLKELIDFPWKEHLSCILRPRLADPSDYRNSRAPPLAFTPHEEYCFGIVVAARHPGRSCPVENPSRGTAQTHHKGEADDHSDECEATGDPRPNSCDPWEMTGDICPDRLLPSSGPAHVPCGVNIRSHRSLVELRRLRQWFGFSRPDGMERTKFLAAHA
ncbi:MAG: hypothetical protein HUU20_28735 [Pirellulales bacterium]|nr:hypothetical protein [Pirellulales bacterium]